MAHGIFPLFNVSDVEKSVEFYKGLGLEAKVRTEHGMTWGEVRSGDQMLMLADKDKGPDAGDPWLQGELGKGVLMTIGVRSARRTFAKAQALRASIDRPLQAQPWGGMGFMLSDPDGYVVSFTDSAWEDLAPKREAVKKRGAAKGRSAGRAAGKRGAGKRAGGKRAAPKRAAKRRR